MLRSLLEGPRHVRRLQPGTVQRVYSLGDTFHEIIAVGEGKMVFINCMLSFLSNSSW
jgi:hypothetical protein